MENIVRDVRDINAPDRQAIEHVVGQALRDNQRLVIQIVSLDLKDAETVRAAGGRDRQAACLVQTSTKA